jgi:hypothetical protein
VRGGLIDGVVTQQTGGLLASELEIYLKAKVEDSADGDVDLEWEDVQPSIANTYQVCEIQYLLFAHSECMRVPSLRACVRVGAVELMIALPCDHVMHRLVSLTCLFCVTFMVQVVYATLLGDNPRKFMVSRHFTNGSSAADNASIIYSAILAVISHGFLPLSMTGDGAQINRSVFLKLGAEMKASTFFDEEEMSLWPDIDFDFPLAMPNPVWGWECPIVWLGDSPHWLKKCR